MCHVDACVQYNTVRSEGFYFVSHFVVLYVYLHCGETFFLLQIIVASMCTYQLGHSMCFIAANNVLSVQRYSVFQLKF
jgi:hypothetical protein